MDAFVTVRTKIVVLGFPLVTWKWRLARWAGNLALLAAQAVVGTNFLQTTIAMREFAHGALLQTTAAVGVFATLTTSHAIVAVVAPTKLAIIAGVLVDDVAAVSTTPTVLVILAISGIPDVYCNIRTARVVRR